MKQDNHFFKLTEKDFKYNPQINLLNLSTFKTPDTGVE